MKVTIGQINTTNGDIDGNTAKIIAAIENPSCFNARRSANCRLQYGHQYAR